MATRATKMQHGWEFTYCIEYLRNVVMDEPKDVLYSAAVAVSKVWVWRSDRETGNFSAYTLLPRRLVADDVAFLCNPSPPSLSLH